MFENEKLTERKGTIGDITQKRKKPKLKARKVVETTTGERQPLENWSFKLDPEHVLMMKKIMLGEGKNKTDTMKLCIEQLYNTKKPYYDKMFAEKIKYAQEE